MQLVFFPVLTHEAYQCLSKLEREQQGDLDEETKEEADVDELPALYDFEVMRRNQLDWRQEQIQYEIMTENATTIQTADAKF